jgi:hypothetical protein
MKFVISNQKFFRNHPVSLQELLSFRQNCPEKFFIRLLTAKMSTINLCKMQKAPAGNCKGCSARRGEERSFGFALGFRADAYQRFAVSL